MKHIDCNFYLAIDVFKGICKRTKEDIPADGESCNDFEKAARCKYCSNYAPQKEELGVCMDKTPAYPEMEAKQCRHFQWVQ